MVDVHFLDLREEDDLNYEQRFSKLLKKTEILKNIDRRKSCAIKIHPGEAGNIYFVQPQFVKIVYDILGENSFLTDTTTLYTGERRTATDYHRLAKNHGFDFAPFIVADGLRGEGAVHVDGFPIASVITAVPQLVVVSHFKGHLLTGFGAAIKNLGMGCSAKAGKLLMHSTSKPTVNKEKCKKCYICVDYCPQAAISKNDPVEIDQEKCTGCCGCISICPNRAFDIDWNASAAECTKRIVEYAKAVVKDKTCVYINFIVNITRHCDCFHTTEPPITNDVGILISTDPVAIDKASFDLVEAAIRDAHPDVDPLIQIEHAVKIGLGSSEYRLTKK